VVRPDEIPTGDTLALNAQRQEVGTHTVVGAGMALAEGRAPACTLPGTFSPGWHRGRACWCGTRAVAIRAHV
jgi:hypothetical protein